MDLSSAHWHKSTKSGNNGGNCVEVAADLPGVVAVRDSKDRKGPALVFASETFQTFVAAIKEQHLA
ncbi:MULTISPECIES: DUF397 domain-containing protein [unclassified Micromonospora]|uniref:DUF397 domain-containing protein n=1 Tax=unclassified Micromonospora TaxID=2617518 RepID=UPI0022C23E2E|nr:DUF397 domain-containing protein [Micromonospora sp. AKA38]GHJ13226.1 hypothetical protein TPA0908_12210 [Micromonospora sp. AKA38]